MNLYVTDLDGTLLNNKKEVSDYSKLELSNLIKNNINFTVATARTPATVVDLLKDIEPRIPAVLMNGVLIYDILNKKYIDIESIEDSSVKRVLDIVSEFNKYPLIYAISNEELHVFYKNLVTKAEQNFYSERCNKPLKKFIKVNNYNECIEGCSIINFIIFGEYHEMKNIYKRVLEVDGLSVDFYEDIYNRGTYCLECYSKKASKANGIKKLKNYVNYSNLITFGDNINDIPMFKISDECYAMENAVEDLKKIATEVIKSNEENGVVIKIKDMEMR